MPPAEDQLVNILLIVVVVHLQVLVNAQVLHFSNVSIPIGVVTYKLFIYGINLDFIPVSFTFCVVIRNRLLEYEQILLS